MRKDTHIEFVLTAKIQGMVFNPHRPEGLEFKPEGETEPRFVLMPASPEDAHGNSHGLECKVYASYKACSEQIKFVDSYKNKVMLRVAESIELPFKPMKNVLIAKDGSCAEGFRPDRYLCPEDIATLVSSAETDLTYKMNRFLKLLRWRQGVYSPSEIVQYQSLYWRVDEDHYSPAPPAGGGPKTIIIDGVGEGISWGDEHSASLQELWINPNITEPLGHILLREAAAIAEESPRSSIMIMTSALEAAVKIHISNKVPSTDWLMEEMPSPPIHKVFSKFLPLIHPQADYLHNIKPFVRKIEELFSIRNKVAHTGKIPERIGTKKTLSIQEYLNLVSDMLCLLDVLDGHEWAKPFARYGLQKALDWPSLNAHTLTIEKYY